MWWEAAANLRRALGSLGPDAGVRVTQEGQSHRSPIPSLLHGSPSVQNLLHIPSLTLTLSSYWNRTATGQVKCLYKLQLRLSLGEDSKLCPGGSQPLESPYSYNTWATLAENQDASSQRSTYHYYRKITSLILQKVQMHFAYSPSRRKHNDLCQSDLV